MDDTDSFGLLLLVIALACVWFAGGFRARHLRPTRAEFIGTYQWPPGLLDKLAQRHPALTSEDATLIARGLRQFFMAYLMSGNKFVAMPSQIVDELWHEFILYTRDYQQFCAKAFGKFMHHTPAAAMRPAAVRRTRDGLRRVWWFACKDEGIDPKQPCRLPLLFALDGQLQIPNGFRYDLDCDALKENGVTGVHCANDLHSPVSCGA